MRDHRPALADIGGRRHAIRMKERLRRGEEGFTLVELLIVVAIPATLVAVVMANESLSSVPAIAVATNDMTDAAGGWPPPS
jgi:prepilin-type N-terminal cleavage/methylation domain-containing protein